MSGTSGRTCALPRSRVAPAFQLTYQGPDQLQASGGRGGDGRSWPWGRKSLDGENHRQFGRRAGVPASGTNLHRRHRLRLQRVLPAGRSFSTGSRRFLSLSVCGSGRRRMRMSADGLRLPGVVGAMVDVIGGQADDRRCRALVALPASSAAIGPLVMRSDHGSFMALRRGRHAPSTKQAAHYTRAARRRTLAAGALHLLAEPTADLPTVPQRGNVRLFSADISVA